MRKEDLNGFMQEGPWDGVQDLIDELVMVKAVMEEESLLLQTHEVVVLLRAMQEGFSVEGS